MSPILQGQFLVTTLATGAFHGVGASFGCVILRFVPGMLPVHRGILMRQRLGELQEAKKAATRRGSHERKLVQKEGTLAVEESVRLTTLKKLNVHNNGKKAKKRARVKVGEPSQRRCGCCTDAGHNSRTCRKEAAIDPE
jgi:hypothetical protein